MGKVRFAGFWGKFLHNYFFQLKLLAGYKEGNKRESLGFSCDSLPFFSLNSSLDTLLNHSNFIALPSMKPLLELHVSSKNSLCKAPL